MASSINGTQLPPAQPGHFRDTPYHYLPTEWICIMFLVLFTISGVIHIVEAISTRLWFMLYTAALANLGEVLGWAARLWSNRNPTLQTPFIMQITTTIIAPTPLVAANFVILGQLIIRLGSRFSRMGAKTYTVVFVTCDIVALVVQAIGGATASRAVKTDGDPEKGGHIMLAGIVFQMAAITIYVTLASEFILRFLSNNPLRKPETKEEYQVQPWDKQTKLMLLGLAFTSVTIFIRSVYRTIELTDGWEGKIISTQHLFNILDGGMITLATSCMNVLHPGFLLGNGRTWRHEERTRTKNEDDELQIKELNV